MKAVKENKVYTITESQRKAYAAQGFDITDDRRKIIEYAAGKTVPYAKYAALLEENKRLKKQRDILGQELLDKFGPFHKAKAAAVQIIVEAKVDDFRLSAYAIEVEVENGFAKTLAAVLVHDGKSWGVYNVVNLQKLAKSLDERRLASSHCAVESHDAALAKRAEEFLGSRRQGIECRYVYLHSIIVFSAGMLPLSCSRNS